MSFIVISHILMIFIFFFYNYYFILFYAVDWLISIEALNYLIKFIFLKFVRLFQLHFTV